MIFLLSLNAEVVGMILGIISGLVLLKLILLLKLFVCFHIRLLGVLGLLDLL